MDVLYLFTSNHSRCCWWWCFSEESQYHQLSLISSLRGRFCGHPWAACRFCGDVCAVRVPCKCCNWKHLCPWPFIRNACYSSAQWTEHAPKSFCPHKNFPHSSDSFGCSLFFLETSKFFSLIRVLLFLPPAVYKWLSAADCSASVL
jgi:hypothetical protein